MSEFSPHTRQMDERSIDRIQRDFTAGVFSDIPASNVPDTGLAYLKNFVNHGDRLSGRTGSKLWGNYDTNTSAATLPGYGGTISCDVSIVGDTRLLYNISGYAFTSDDVGSYVVVNGVHEKILQVNGGSEIVTELNDQSVTTGYDAFFSLRMPVNGLYYHKSLKKIILHIGSNLYVARDLQISQWDEIYCESYDGIENSNSTFEENVNNLIIFNTGGIFKVDLTNHPTSPVFYYKINSKCPSKPDDSTATSGTYSKRYTYTLSKFTNNTPLQDKNRQSADTFLMTESGSCYVDADNIDYAVHYFDSPIHAGAGNTVEGFSIPEVESNKTEKHWDCFSIYGTLDIGDNGVDPITDDVNDKDLFVWIADIPMFKALKGTFATDTLTLTEGTASEADIGSTIYVGSEYGTIINAYPNSGVYMIDPSDDGITNGSNLICSIGTTTKSRLTCTGGTVTLLDTTFNSYDVGKRIFLSDGRILHILSVDGATGTIAETSLTISTSIVGCWETTTTGVDQGSDRKFYDNIPDDPSLRGRISAYPLYQRFFTEFPAIDIGTLTNGFLFTATRDDTKMYYSSVPDGFEYLMGYYHSYYQESVFKDSIRAFGIFPDSLAVYCANSTYIVPTNVVDSTQIPNLGIYIPVISGQKLVDSSIGVLDYGSIQTIELGKQIMITNEPAIRIFDGISYSENLSSQRMSNILKSLQSATSSIYTPFLGYIFWGLDE